MKWRPQRKSETSARYEAWEKKFAAWLRARADKTKATLKARRAKSKSALLADTTGVRQPDGFHPSMVPQKPTIISLPLPKDRNNNHLRGLPTDHILREVRRQYRRPIRVGTEEMVTIDRLLTTVIDIKGGLKRQRRSRGRRLAYKTLRGALVFLYKQKIPLRSGEHSEAVREYARKLMTDEPQLKNPQTTARSRLRRLTDLRRKQGFPDPTPGRKPK